MPPDSRIEQLESAVRTVCEPIFNKPLYEISFAQVLMRLFRVAQRFDVEVQPQLILLHKTLFNIEGLGRELYPELDLWKTAQPVLRQWMDEQVGAQAVIDDLRENLPQLRQAMRELPAAIRELADRASAGNLSLDVRSEEIERIRAELESQRSQRYWLIVAMTSILSGALVLTLEGNAYVGGGLLVAGLLGIFAGRPNA